MCWKSLLGKKSSIWTSLNCASQVLIFVSDFLPVIDIEEIGFLMEWDYSFLYWRAKIGEI